MNTILQYGPPISLAQAKRLAEAAAAEADRNGWKMVIAILDSASQVVLVQRMDQAQYGSVALAQAKARTAVDFKRPTKVFEDIVAQGGVGLRALAMEGVCPLEGGVPIVEAGLLIGAIGVSGAKASEDGVVANAALQAVDA